MKGYIFRPLVGLLLMALGLIFLSPNSSPVRAQDPVQTLESDDPRVIQSGTWSNQGANGASGNSYLYSNGAEADVLALAFVGSAIEIRYVAGPALGTLAVEIDGTVVRTVITTTEKIEYGQSARVDYLSDEPHSLKVYAQAGGRIAVDAFLISPIVGDGPVPSQDAPLTDEGGIQASTCAPFNAIHRVSVRADGQAGNNDSMVPVLSSNGRYVAFASLANNLVAGDTNGAIDVFMVDRQTCTLTLISATSSGIIGNGHSQQPALSADGRYVAFFSAATNLVAGDTNGFEDVFIHDRNTSTLTRVSVATGGTQATGGNSSYPALSTDGRYVAFFSAATNLVAGDTNGFEDVFIHDRQTTTTTRVSVATGGTQGNEHSVLPTLSADARYVTFQSDATNLVAGDTNGLLDIFVHDRNTNTTTRVSVATGGTQATGEDSAFAAISSDGRYVAFHSDATNLVAGDTNVQTDVFVHDRQTNTTTRVNVATGGTQATGGNSANPRFSADGRYVTFYSAATNLVTGDTNAEFDAFVHDRQTNTTTRVSVAAGGTQANDSSYTPVLSADGRYVTFFSDADNLIAGDTNVQPDVFVTLRSQPAADTLALFNPTFNHADLINTLLDNPPVAAYTAFSAYAPVTNGQWVMGDWNNDGLDTPGVYANGPFYYTNKLGESQASDWRSLWIGVNGPPVSGRFSNLDLNDCIGAVQSANFPPFGTAFVLYFTCDLSGNPAPTVSFQWLSIVLPDSGGFSGTHQFGAGDFNSDGLDSIAIRRGTTIAFGNTTPSVGPATFDLAQFIGAPGTGSEGIFVVGDWNADGVDSFGLFYQNGELFYRNDLLFNSGAYTNQSVGTPFAGTVQATTWR